MTLVFFRTALFRGRLFLYFFLAGAASSSVACGPDGADPLGPAIRHYCQGWEGSDSALKKGIELLEGLEKSAGREERPRVRAYLGSAYVASARWVPDRQKRGVLTRGVRQLNSAVRSAPDDVEVRLLRAVTLAVLPRLAGQMETLEEDLQWLLDRVDSGELSAACRFAILYQAGSFQARNRDAEAIGLLRRAAETAPTPDDREKAQRLLRLASAQFPRDSGDR